MHIVADAEADTEADIESALQSVQWKMVQAAYGSNT